MGVINTPLRGIIGDFFQNNTITQTISLGNMFSKLFNKLTSKCKGVDFGVPNHV